MLVQINRCEEMVNTERIESIFFDPDHSSEGKWFKIRMFSGEEVFVSEDIVIKIQGNIHG